MGPEAGAGGGRVVTEGPPEDIVIHARRERQRYEKFEKTPRTRATAAAEDELVRSHTGEALDAFGLLDESPQRSNNTPERLRGCISAKRAPRT